MNDVLGGEHDFIPLTCSYRFRRSSEIHVKGIKSCSPPKTSFTTGHHVSAYEKKFSASFDAACSSGTTYLPTVPGGHRGDQFIYTWILPILGMWDSNLPRKKTLSIRFHDLWPP